MVFGLWSWSWSGLGRGLALDLVLGLGLVFVLGLGLGLWSWSWSLSSFVCFLSLSLYPSICQSSGPSPFYTILSWIGRKTASYMS